MINANVTVPPPSNEPILSYAPGSNERAALKAELTKLAGQRPELPLVIGGKEVRTGNTYEQRMPHAHQHVLATVHSGDAGTSPIPWKR